MADSLRDQLIKAGLGSKPAGRKPRRKQHAAKAPGQGKARPARQQVGGGKGIDLAKAYALRAKVEKREVEQDRNRKEAEARERKERNRRIRELLDGKALNRADAELVRHFEYGGKIRRIYVDKAQQAAINAGQLGVIQLRGRYVLVTDELVREIRTFAPDHVALWLDPADTSDEADDGVPDDLVW